MSQINQYRELLLRLLTGQTERYQALPQRDQNMLKILALFLAISIPLFGIILPLENQHKAMVENVQALKLQANEAERFAELLQNGGIKPASGNVMSDVDRIARSSGVREFMTRIKPQIGIGGNSGLIVQMKSVPYEKVVSFVAALADRGFGVSQMKLHKADSAGQVHLQAVITGG